MNTDINIESLLKLAQKIIKQIEDNFDSREKVVGDRVLVWDGSYNKDKNTGIRRDGTDPLFKTDAIVIKVQCKETVNVEEIIKIEELLDLLLYFSDGTEIYCSSSCVKIVD